MAELLDRDILNVLVDKINKTTKEEGDCLISLRRNQEVHYNHKNYNIPRSIWQHYNKGEVPSGYTYQPTCGNSKCIKEEHLHYGFKGNPTDKESIRQLIQSRSKLTPDGKCRIVSCTTNKRGYGLWTINGKLHPLGRVIIWIASDYDKVTDLPSELVAGHLCRNLLCINLDHYELITSSVNNYEHRIRDGTLLRGQESHLSKITEQHAKAIIASYRPKGHVEFMTGRERALKFGVSPASICLIDSRQTWSHLPHPNELPVASRKARKMEHEDDNKRCGLNISAEDLVKLHDRLKNFSQPAQEINQYTQTACWLWKTPRKQRPTLSYRSTNISAAIIACYISSGRKPFEDAVARHKCGQSLCVFPEHLEWGSRKENSKDMRIHGTSSQKLTMDDAREIRGSDEKGVELAVRFNVTQSCISNIRTGFHWKE